MTTTVITRLYGDAQSARGVRERLYREGFPSHTLSLVTAAAGDTADTIKLKMERALVPSEAAETYAIRVAEGGGLVVVRATYKPLNAVRIATETFETSGALPTNLPSQAFRIKTPKDHAPSILKDHPRFLTISPEEDLVRGFISERQGFRMLSAPRTRDSVIRGGKLFFGDGVVRKPRKLSTRRSGPMSAMFWPMPLISRKERKSSVIKGGGNTFSRWLGWPTN